MKYVDLRHEFLKSIKHIYAKNHALTTKKWLFKHMFMNFLPLIFLVENYFVHFFTQ